MNGRNYQRELDLLLGSFMEKGMRPRLLLHACCAPCSSYCLEYLSRYMDITVFFYNPNMDSLEEYERRAAELKRFIHESGMDSSKNFSEISAGGSDGVPESGMNSDNRAAESGMSGRVGIIVGDYEPEAFERIALGHESDPERGERCRRCYRLRIGKTAAFMKAYNERHPDDAFDYFATTLTLSPLKDAEALNDISRQIADQYGLKCLETDFKKKNGYKRSIELSRQYSLYRQNYCGCRFSKEV